MRIPVLICALMSFSAIAAERGQGAPMSRPTPTEEAYFKAALQAAGTGKSAYARKVLEYLVRRQPGKALYWFNLGNILFLSGQHRQALGPYRKVVDLGSPLAPVAWIYSAKCYRELGELPYSAGALAAALKFTLPGNLSTEAQAERALLAEAYESKAAQAYRAGDYDGALGWIHGLVALSALSPLAPLSTDAKVLRGMALMRKGEGVAARRVLAEAANGISEPGRRAEVLELHRLAVEQGIDTGENLLQLRVSTGYDSNLYGDGRSESATAVPTMELGASYRRDLGPRAEVIGAVHLQEAVGLPEDRFLRLETSGALGFGSETARFGNLRFFLYPRAQAEFLSTRAYLGSLGTGLGVELGKKQVVGLYLHLARNLPLAAEAAYLLGYAQVRKGYFALIRGRLTTIFSLVDQVDGGLDLSVANGLLPLAGRSVGPAVSIAWKAGTRTDFDASVSYLFRFFDQAARPANEKRVDRQLELGARFSRRLTADVASHFSVNYVRNGSTLGESSVDDKNYEQWIARGGVSWQTSW